MAKVKQTADGISAASPKAPDTESHPAEQVMVDKPIVTESASQVTAAEPDEFILGILKSFSTYATLYIDRHGGVYTPDTPHVIRGNAVLYTNPFHKS